MKYQQNLNLFGLAYFSLPNPAESSIATMKYAFEKSSDLQKVTEKFKEQVHNEYDQVWDMMGVARTVLVDSGVTILGLANGYGCHCMFQNDRLKQGAGRGQPMDIFDEKCRVLTKAYNCVSLDDFDENLNQNCEEPWMMEYNIPTITVGTDAITECNALNPEANECVLRTCYIETHFLVEIAKITNFQLIFPDLLAYSHTIPGSTFNFNDECAISLNLPVQKGFACCGKYPNRVEYGLVDSKECCGNRVFNVVAKECCDENTSQVATIGEC